MARVRVQVPVDQAEAQQPAPEVPQPIAPQSAPVQPRQFITPKNLKLAGVLILAAAVVFLLFSLMHQKKVLKQEVDKLSTTQSTSQADAKYQQNVAKVVEVPAGITPQTKTPTDAELSQLSKDNPIYKSTKSGDVFLVYTNPDKSLYVVIYRPSTGKVILATAGSQPAAPVNTKP